MTLEQFIKENEEIARALAGKRLAEVDRLFQKYISKIVKLYQSNSFGNSTDITPAVKKEFEKISKELANELESLINAATREQWISAQTTANKFVETYFEVNALKKATQQIYRTENLDEYFKSQKSRLTKFKLSDRVWKYSKQFEQQMQDAFEIALMNGDSAQKLSRDIKQYLNEPERLYRRVRDTKGQLHLSKNAQLYNPGQGVYRSSHKNALRLASSEINAYYKASENQRWQSMDFVVGFEVKRSNNKFDCDICGSLIGKYPKSFQFVGWHPNCRCYQIPILKPVEMFTDELKGAVKEDYSHLGNFQSEIKEMPANFQNHLKEKADIYKGWKVVPYWVK